MVIPGTVDNHAITTNQGVWTTGLRVGSYQVHEYLQNSILPSRDPVGSTITYIITKITEMKLYTRK